MNVQLSELEFRSYPGMGRPSKRVEETINGHVVRCESRMQYGRLGGKGFKTIWYVDGARVAKANVESVVFN